MKCYLQRENINTNCSDLHSWSYPTNIDIPLLIKGCIALIIINAALSISVICSNAAVIFTILRTPSLKKPSNYLILVLALADLGVGALVAPCFCVTIACTLARNYQCLISSKDVYTITGSIFITASIWTLAALTADRLIAITLHLRYREIVTVVRTGVICTIIWIFAILSSLSWLSSIIPFLISTNLTGLIILITILFMAKIELVIRRHSRQIRLKESIVLCYFPFFVFYWLLQSSISPPIILFKIFETLMFANSLLNPIIYFWRINELRIAGRQLMRRFFQLVAEAPH
ncbi:melanocortin receptor 4-like [Exaiptasia diaphana]|uniref:G-protein coupled receptors family 1 profile domain-containing protein n=1 Tax=Exaiptasia diaphana TaxID=2652724 RepID=A0A913YMV9_EXADI|nr:melanocortin receptor 4-like [Exaiptasia diaphana]